MERLGVDFRDFLLQKSVSCSHQEMKLFGSKGKIILRGTFDVIGSVE